MKFSYLYQVLASDTMAWQWQFYLELKMKTRIAKQIDLPAIVDIYNQTIDSRMVTADTEPQSVASKQAWFDSHTDTRPIYVVEDNEQVVAWLSFKSFYGRPAYNGTVEIAIYVDSNQRGKQIGQTLLQFAESLAPELQIKSLLAFIFSHNTPSMRLFIKNDFAVWGELPNVAKMDEKEYSLTILGKRVGEN